MNPLIYNVIHVVSIMAVFAALGAVAASEGTKHHKLGAALHGLALLLILVSGFGMLAKYNLGFPWWIMVKLIIWVAIGGMLAVAKRRALPCGAVIGIILALGTISAVLGVFGRSFGVG
jgi:hypothetical protein